jgi:hypothetical protein
MDKLKEKITVPNIIILFIIMQPIIDIITALTIEYLNITITFGIIIRTVFMVILAVLGVIKAKGKYKIGMCIYYVLLFVYMAGVLINYYICNGTSLIFIQIKGLIKSMYLPIVLIALIPIFKEYKMNIDKRVLKNTLMIYVCTIFVCSVIGIAFPTYKAGDKAGTVGLFYSANEIGAILCLLSPFLVMDLIDRKLTIKDGVYCLLYVYAVLQLGTKVPYFGLIILIADIVMICIIKAKKQKEKYLYKKSAMFFACLIAIYLVTGLTPVGDNLTRIYGNIFLVTTDTFTKDSSTTMEVTEFENFEEFKTASVSERNDYLAANKEKFTNSNVVVKLLGIGYVENADGELQELKLSEMDFYDILFCNGILGTILFTAPLLYFVIQLILSKEKITAELVYSMVMTVVVALLAGHVLVSPAVSIYVAIILVNSQKFNLPNKAD